MGTPFPDSYAHPAVLAPPAVLASHVTSEPPMASADSVVTANHVVTADPDEFLPPLILAPPAVLASHVTSEPPMASADSVVTANPVVTADPDEFLPPLILAPPAVLAFHVTFTPPVTSASPAATRESEDLDEAPTWGFSWTPRSVVQTTSSSSAHSVSRIVAINRLINMSPALRAKIGWQHIQELGDHAYLFIFCPDQSEIEEIFAYLVMCALNGGSAQRACVNHRWIGHASELLGAVLRETTFSPKALEQIFELLITHVKMARDDIRKVWTELGQPPQFYTLTEDLITTNMQKMLCEWRGHVIDSHFPKDVRKKLEQLEIDFSKEDENEELESELDRDKRTYEQLAVMGTDGAVKGAMFQQFLRYSQKLWETTKRLLGKVRRAGR